jgi:putative transposase
VQERAGAPLVLTRLRFPPGGTPTPRFAGLRRIWADAGYFSANLIAWMKHTLGLALCIVARPPGQQGFRPLPRRWVVERTFAWFGRFRRLSKDYEQNPASSEAYLYLAMTHLMVRRLAA